MAEGPARRPARLELSAAGAHRHSLPDLLSDARHRRQLDWRTGWGTAAPCFWPGGGGGTRDLVHRLDPPTPAAADGDSGVAPRRWCPRPPELLGPAPGRELGWLARPRPAAVPPGAAQLISPLL